MMSAFYDDGRFAGMGNIDLISIYHINEICRRIEILKSGFPNKMIAASMMSDSKEGWQSTARALVDAGVDLEWGLPQFLHWVVTLHIPA